MEFTKFYPMYSIKDIEVMVLREIPDMYYMSESEYPVVSRDWNTDIPLKDVKILDVEKFLDKITRVDDVEYKQSWINLFNLLSFANTFLIVRAGKVTVDIYFIAKNHNEEGGILLSTKSIET